MGRLTKPLDEAAVKATRMTHAPIREIHLADDRMFNDSLDAYRDIVNKLGGNEDIEEGLGINLATLSNAIKGIEHRSVYNVEEKRDVFVNTIIYYENDLIIKGYAEHSTFLVKDYGVTWVLTKEELL